MSKGRFGLLLVLAALTLPAAVVSQNEPGPIELTALGRHTWMSSDRPIENGFGVGGALGLFLTQRIKLTASASYTPSELLLDGSSVGYVPLNLRIAYELPLTDRVHAVAGSGWVLNLYPNDGSDDTGVGSAAGLRIRLSDKLWLHTQVTHDWMPPWLNQKTFIITNPSSRSFLIKHASDVHMAFEAGLSARFAGGRDQPVVATVPVQTPTPTPVQEPPRQQTPPPQQQTTTPPQQQTPPARESAPPPDASVRSFDRYVMLDPVYFDFDKSDIRADAREILVRAVVILRANPGAVIVLEGHTDERGSNAYNDALGRRRAQSVFAFLSSQGIESNRLQTVSLGEARPADPAQTADAFARNRRVMLTVQGDARLRDPGR